MLDHLLKTLVTNMGTSAYGSFTSMFIPNQTLPAENTLLSQFTYGQQSGKSLNNVVRIAEVADGLIVKLPMINAVKVPFSVVRKLSIHETGTKLKITIQFHKDGLGTVQMTLPIEAKGQFPMLLKLEGQAQAAIPAQNITTPTPTPQFDESDLWTIPKSKSPTQKNAPIQLKNWNIWEKVRAGIVIWMLIELVSYLSRTF